MAYTDADLLNMYLAFSYGSSTSEVKIQELSSSDKIRFAKLVESNWNAKKTSGDAKAILSLQSKGIPFSSALISSVKQYQSNSTLDESNKAVVSTNQTIRDSSQLSTTSNNSKNAQAVANGGVKQEADNNSLPVSTSRSSSSIINSSINPTEDTRQIVVAAQPRNDRRARLSPKAAIFNQLITQDGIMSPLRETYGLMFPITPTISENVEVNYESYDMTHGLMPIQAYRSGGQKTLSINAMFTAQTDVEARYCLACIHFIRSFSKMNFGEEDPNSGTPPPILIFNAYGDAVFRNIPVVIANATFDWPNDVDYIYTTARSSPISPVSSTGSMIADGWVPSKFTISLTLNMQPTPAKLKEFNLEKFRNGTFYRSGGGWI